MCRLCRSAVYFDLDRSSSHIFVRVFTSSHLISFVDFGTSRFPILSSSVVHQSLNLHPSPVRFSFRSRISKNLFLSIVSGASVVNLFVILSYTEFRTWLVHRLPVPLPLLIGPSSSFTSTQLFTGVLGVLHIWYSLTSNSANIVLSVT
jgi:hypothetical protein